MRTEEEIKNYVENLIPDFKEHKKRIIDAYGIDKYLSVMKERLALFKKFKEENPHIPIEDVVIFFNDQVEKRCLAGEVGLQDMIYNQQLNIIAGMRIRGYEI